MQTKSVPTFQAWIYVGFRVRYTEKVHNIDEVKKFLHKFCDDVGFCVTITPTEFIYTNTSTSSCPGGEEPGAIIGIINYPRFPSEFSVLKERSILIAKELLEILEQGKVSIVFPDETVMLSAE